MSSLEKSLEELLDDYPRELMEKSQEELREGSLEKLLKVFQRK